VKALLVVLALAGCGSPTQNIAYGTSAILAGSISLEMAKRTEDPLTTPIVAHAVPTLALGILLLTEGISVACGDRPFAYHY
jgi:hypothetical protein